MLLGGIHGLKKCTNFKTVQLKIIRIDFDDIWQKYSKDSRIEFACFSFRIGLLFINFSRHIVYAVYKIRCIADQQFAVWSKKIVDRQQCFLAQLQIAET